MRYAGAQRQLIAAVVPVKRLAQAKSRLRTVLSDGQRRDFVLAMLEETRVAPLVPGLPKGLVVPHAGYIYSGAVAANAYALLRPAVGIVKRVVLDFKPARQTPE